MTETRMNIELDMELTPDLLVGMQDGPEASLDHVVGDTLVPDRGYAGMVVSFAGTVVTVGAGRLYNAGKVYAFDTPATFDVLAKSKLPVATKRIMLLVAYGTEQDSAPEQVNFLVEALSTPAAPVYKPQAMAREHQRVAVVQDAYGDEAPNPAYPGYGLALPVAVAVLGPTGIISLSNIPDGKLPNLADVAKRLAVVEAFDAQAGPQLISLASDLGRLSNALKNTTSQALLGRMLVSIADLDAKVGIPTDAADASSDYLLVPDTSDITDPLSSVKVQEGVRFPDDGANDVPLQIFNQYDPGVMLRSGVLFPAFDRGHRVACGPGIGSTAINSYKYYVQAYQQLQMSRQRTRFGTSFTVCSNSAFWNSGQYDPVLHILTLPSGDTFSVDFAGYSDALHAAVDCPNYRVTQFWTDTYTEPYWGYAATPGQLNGCHVAESWANGQDMWVESILLYFDAIDVQGDVDVLFYLAKDTGAPDLSSVLGRAHIALADLKPGVNTFSFQPFFIKSGSRVGFDVVSSGAHKIVYADGGSYPQGAFFTLTDAGFAVPDLTKHIAFDLYACQFRNSFVTVQLQNLQLAGGITDIDILSGAVVPESCSLTYEVQINGVWTALSAATGAALASGGALPPNLGFRATFAGSPGVMPAIDTLHSNVHVSRPKTALTHIWPAAPRTPPVPTSQVRVIERYEAFDFNFHSAAAQLLSGPNFGTVTSPSSMTDVITSDYALERTYVFNLPAAVPAYRVKSTATTTSPLKVFHGAWIKDYCL